MIVMGHGFGGVRALRLYAYAERFAEAGYVVVAFDYRGFGDSEGSPRQVLDVAMQLQDWRAALQFARTAGRRPIASHRVGTSFGGGHVITLAGQGEPLAAIIAQVPHVSGPAAVRATDCGHHCASRRSAARPGSRVARPRPRLRRSRRAARDHRRHDQPGRRPGLDTQIARGGPAHGDYPQHVAARIGLKIGRYSPSGTPPASPALRSSRSPRTTP